MNSVQPITGERWTAPFAIALCLLIALYFGGQFLRGAF